MKASPRSGALLAILVTCPSAAVANRLGTTLIKRRLAACVNIFPGVSSVFWWQGKVQRCKEVLLLIKTTVRCFEPLKRAVIQLHPYEVPEIIALPIVKGHLPYLLWVASSIRQETPPRFA
jgi:periplasmic divalent cation tolerance protein